jgi:hypothetical protein
MMKWMIDVKYPKPQRSINYKDAILLSGSCFAEQMGHKLISHRFNVNVNTHGILYNPVSLAESMLDVIQNKIYVTDELTGAKDLWFSWKHHGKFADTKPEGALVMMNHAIAAGHQTLATASHVVFTWGSAWVYQLKSSGQVVANCHKMPSDLFVKRLLSVDEIVHSYNTLLQHPILKDKQVVFSVSPVRYLRDGLVENNLSKAILLQAAHNLCKMHGHAFYFPAYEMIIDVLRDYRFYERDMLHPNVIAIDFVWEQFCEACMDSSTQQFVQEMNELNLMMAHTLLHPNTTEASVFLAHRASKIYQLKNRYPEINFGEGS